LKGKKFRLNLNVAVLHNQFYNELAARVVKDKAGKKQGQRTAVFTGSCG
jgi:hypothetical protein